VGGGHGNWEKALQGQTAKAGLVFCALYFINKRASERAHLMLRLRA